MPFDFNPLAQPPSGSVEPADLYIDRASRQLWLGVDPTVDPSGSVLISDIVALLAYADQSEADAKAYTDTQIATRAPLSHTHPSSQITDFNAAVDARIAASPTTVVPVGTVQMYAGAIGDLGLGDLANWMLCDGRSLIKTDYPKLNTALGNGSIWGSVDGTHFNIPNLRDYFVVGAGNVPSGTRAAGAAFVTNTVPGHQHTGVTGGLSLAVGHLPAHHHGPGTLQGSDSFSGTTGAKGSHNHVAGDAILGGSLGGSGMRAWTNTGQPTGFTDTEPDHSHSFSGSVTVQMTSGITADTGNGTAHSHTISLDGGHNHSITAAQVKAALNNAALCYIIRVS